MNTPPAQLDYPAGERARSLWNADIPNLVRLVRDAHILVGLNHVVEAAAQRGDPDLVRPLMSKVDPRGLVPGGVIARLERIVRSAIAAGA